VRFVYRRLRTHAPVATMGGVFVRHKPIIQVVLTANDRTILSRGLLDSGSDDTVFPRTSGEELGIMFDGLPKLGQAGFLQFFTVEFRGDTHEAVLTPNGTFPGVVS